MARRVLSREIVKVPRAVARRAGVQIARGQYALRASRPPEEVVRRALAPGVDIASALAAFRAPETPRFFFTRADAADVIGLLERTLPGWRERVVGDADRICAHVVRLLGADAVDLDAYSARDGSCGGLLPWHDDVVNGYGWDPRTFYRQIPVPYDRADMKVPWELARGQHLTTVGIAFRATGEERYAREVVAQIDDFILRNPVGYGINWVSTMDVAIRAVNWLWAYELVADAESVSDGFVTRLLASLLAHGRHIEENISVYEGGVTTNHTVADYAGLVYLGFMLPQLGDAARWREAGIVGLSACMAAHVSRDGVDYENSVAYHRLVTEMYLGAFLLAQRNGREFPPDYRASLERMLEFVLHYMPPNGLAPLVGDSDDGRWHLLGRYFDWQPRDHRHLLGVVAAAFDRPDFARAASESPAAVEEAAWLGGLDAGKRITAARGPAPVLTSRAFPDGGRYVMRSSNHHALVSTDEVGTNGYGNHKHNDIFSFELVVNGRPAVVDCGSYIYLSDRKTRDAFRATSAHNTLVVDGLEQNDMTDTFRMRARARVTLREWRSTSTFDVLDASHSGYQEGAGVDHRRRLGLQRSPFAWLVADSLEGAGEHDAQSSIHLAPGLAPAAAADDSRRRSPEIQTAIDHLTAELGLVDPLVPHFDAALRCADNDRHGVLVVPLNSTSVAVETGWVAPRYGKREPAKVIRMRSRLRAGTLVGYLILEA